MQKWTYKSLAHLGTVTTIVDGDEIEAESGTEFYAVPTVDIRIDELVGALKSTAHVLSQMMLRNSAMDGLAKEALLEADRALALMGSDTK